ncbi:Uma2 family endonuclease [Lentzea sp. NPDC042327]|uniref:Uma2 family endonuclease n=1 Tax=Lentzea sp. NPDC042327 TaxID=3154801 RepID=UPI003405699D
MGPWSLDDVLALPEDHRQRIELVDGTLLMSPLGSFRHQDLVFGVAATLRSACPKDFKATIEINVALSDGRLLIPDFTVVERCDAGVTFPVEKVLLVGEVLSKSTRVTDLVVKRQLYAEGGVPYYLVVDPVPDAPVSTLYMRGEKPEYFEIARSVNGVLTLDRHPFPVTIDLND